MASLCRSAAAAGRRSEMHRRRSFQIICAPPIGASTQVLHSVTPSSGAFSSSLLRRSIVSFSAIGSVVELSLMPRHSAKASARLRTFISVNFSSWNWLTQGQTLRL